MRFARNAELRGGSKMQRLIRLLLVLVVMGMASQYSFTPSSDHECIGMKVYWKTNGGVTTTGCSYCQRWICDSTGVEGEDCYNLCATPPEPDNSYYESIRSKFKRGRE
jgi:hypothetical protein